MEKKLYRDEYRKKVAGVCAGLAEYFNIDVAIVRVVFLLALIFHGGGGVIYIVFWIVLPKKPYIFNEPTVDYTVPPQTPGSGSNPYANNPYPGTQIPNQPYPVQPRSTSLAAIIFGVVLILIGGSILLDDFDIIPDWDFGQLWPIIIIAVGCVLIFTGEQRKPWENANWPKADTTDNNKAAENTSEANPPADNPPAV